MFHDAASLSTNTGVGPAVADRIRVAANVNVETSTSSPGRTPHQQREVQRRRPAGRATAPGP